MEPRNRSLNGGAAGQLNQPNPTLPAGGSEAPGHPRMRLANVLFAVVVCAVMVVSAMYVVNPDPNLANRVTTIAAPAGILTHTTDLRSNSMLPAAPSGGIAGSNPANNFPLPGGAVSPVLPPDPTLQSIALAQQIGEREPLNVSDSPYLSAMAQLTGAANAPAKLPTTKLTATVDGVLESSLPPHSPISGAQIEVQPVGGDCQNDTCPPVQSKATGYFNATILAGNDELLITAGEYVTNYTVVTNVTAGGSYHLGTLYMVPDAHVVGYIESALPPHSPISNIQVQGTSRDGKVQALPDAVSSGSGFYNTTVPPGPSILLYSPVAGQGIYISTSRFVDLPAGGWEQFNVTYLEQGVVIQVQAYDRETGKVLSSQEGYSITACQRTAPSTCFQQGAAVCGGQMAQAVGYPGADIIKVEAASGICGNGPDYLTNFTYMNVPVPTSHKPEYLGRVNLVPDAGVQLSSTISWGGTKNKAYEMWGPSPGTIDVIVNTCSLDGFQVGTSVPQAFGAPNTSTSTCITSCTPYPFTNTVFPTFPLRASVVVAPDITGECSPSHLPTW
jgi:hypothetical protein